jgi:hypothetical protein
MEVNDASDDQLWRVCRKLMPMRKELEQKLVERWPSWFDIHGDVRHTLMRFGFQHGDGWFNLLWRLCEDLEPLVAEMEKESKQSFEVLQVKEKFGGLRFSVNQHTDAINERIGAAVQESFNTCELCGKPGQLFQSPWLGVRCGECAQEGANEETS